MKKKVFHCYSLNINYDFSGSFTSSSLDLDITNENLVSWRQSRLVHFFQLPLQEVQGLRILYITITELIKISYFGVVTSKATPALILNIRPN